LKEAGLPVVDYPSVQNGAVSLVSRFGAVREILGMSRAAVVGGSFSCKLGVHNFWEPLTLGVETYVGPFARGHEDFVSLLCQEKAVTQVHSAEDFLNYARPSLERAEALLAAEKKKILNSYSMLLKFLKELL
jgi:3-deoxy-D-manno-octulosonic-acid transferase